MTSIGKPEDLLSLPTAEELLSLIVRVRSLHLDEVKRGTINDAERLGGVVFFDEAPSKLAVIGDLHGDPETLRIILGKLWGVLGSSDGVIVFLGDYIDRGPPEGQVSVLAAVLRLKLLAPHRVILLRGNHEPPPGLEPSPHDFPVSLLHLFDRDAPRLYDESRSLFNTMPYAVLFRGWALLVHGGIPTESLMREASPERILAAGETDPGQVLVEILWNDPTEHVEFRRPSVRGVGYEWGPKATRLALEKLGVNFIIRAHEAVYQGYKLNHGGRVVTLFSRRGFPYGNPKAAFLLCQNRPSAESTLGCIRVVGS